jgi:hypothetical protein
VNPTEILIFLGIEFDTANMIMRLPSEKLNELKPWGYRKRRVLSLYSVYLAKDTEMRTSDILQREEQHQR